MRKIITLLMVIAMMIPLATVTSATENKTTLTLEVLPASYKLNIPENQELESNLEELCNFTVTEAKGFSEFKHLSVTITYDEFRSDSTTTTIPLTIYFNRYAAGTKWESGKSILFKGNYLGGVEENPTVNGTTLSDNRLYAEVSNLALLKAMAGNYTTTVTFTSEVVPAEP